MTKKKKTTLVNENVIRRWGKLANMPALTENFLDTLEEEEEDAMDMEAGAEEPAAEEAPAEEAEASPAEADAVESIVSAVVDAIAQETGVEIEVAGEVDAEGGEEEMGMEMEPAGDEDPAMRDPAMRDAAMRDPAMRDMGEGMRDKKDAAMRDDEKDEDEDKKMKKEELDLEVIDDEELTEAVLRRVVERLLRRK